ncbi:hypothetical protein VE26_07190 [Devosia chinhatensis]|uniref:Uncharacterized protein n=1 Tax=Devosia chinhatensis TaxID=429727 RepID=A0A0F5FM78_9HYPH|nr:hypothetical protein VE26_07190 [Devosia chinhatensis]
MGCGAIGPQQVVIDGFDFDSHIASDIIAGRTVLVTREQDLDSDVHSFSSFRASGSQFADKRRAAQN